MSLLWLLLPLAFCLLRFVTNQYIFSALITLACGAVVAIAGPGGSAWLVVLALGVSALGDWFMAHQTLGPNFFLYGVAGFAVAHALFIAFAARRFAFSLPALLLALALGAGYAFYLNARIFPHVEAPMRLALGGYALISLLGLFFALCRRVPSPERALYAVGIVCILFSDTMIAESQFAGQKWAYPLILPTYYLCHLLVAASQLWR